MRNISVGPPEAWPTPGSHNRFVEIRLCALTPIFKGGSTAAQVDEGRPFRAPSIRGALRYWWRATSTIADVAELRAREKALFGGVHGQGPVASAVSVAILTQESTLGPRPKNKPYAFGVTGREAESEARNRQVHTKATGGLRVEWRDDGAGDEVKRALKAWLLFGGVGGRSRRGAGSVWWNEGLDRPATIEDYIAAWRGLVPERTTMPWPTLAGSVLLVGPAKDSADAAWAEGLDGMSDVRASLDVRREFVQTRGADLLEWKHQDYIPIAAGERFTSRRAALGLPIRFNGRGNGFRGSLEPQGHNRYPSPLHLKVAQLGKQYHPVILAVRGPAPNRLTARHKKGAPTNGTLDATGLDRFLELAAQLPGWGRHG
ncbi:MAG: type III-B CRISPR module RAMP protein Cmr1 [Planctomycetota bacterium]